VRSINSEQGTRYAARIERIRRDEPDFGSVDSSVFNDVQ
jgi:hypothetical protein